MCLVTRTQPTFSQSRLEGSSSRSLGRCLVCTGSVACFGGSPLVGQGGRVEYAVCAVLAPSGCVMFCNVLLCSIEYCLCLLLSLLGCPVGRCGDRGCYVH